MTDADLVLAQQELAHQEIFKSTGALTLSGLISPP